MDVDYPPSDIAYLSGDIASSIDTAPTSAPAATGSVTVHVAADEPIAGVTVEAFTTTEPAEPTEPADPTASAGSCVTTADGTCTITDLPPGTYRLAATAISGPAADVYTPIATVTTTLDGEHPYAVTVEVSDPAATPESTDPAPPVDAPPLVLRRVNPSLAAACGLRVRLVFDLSSSVSAAEAELMRMAAIGFVDVLAGTPTEIAVASFATSAPAAGNADLGFTSVATRGGAIGVRAAIAALVPPDGDDGFTNWDAALRAAAGPGARADVVVVLTDGSPTVWGVPAVLPPVLTDLEQIGAGVRAANRLKAAGTRVVAIGVGDAFEVAAPNLVAISGPVEGDDFTRTSFAGLAPVFARLAGALCPPPEPPLPPEPEPRPEPEPESPRFTG